MKKGMVGVLSGIAGGITGVALVGKTMWDKLEKTQRLSNKHLDLFLMTNEWVRVKQEGKELASYFEKKGYKKIAIYGMHYAGDTLVQELMDSEIEIKYGIDKNAEGVFADFDIVTPDENLEEVDVIVVTAISFYNEIKEMLEKKVNCPIISLDEIIYQV